MSRCLPQGIAELDREFDELAASMTGSEQMASETRERISRLRPRHQVGSVVTMQETEQITAAVPNPIQKVLQGGMVERNMPLQVKKFRDMERSDAVSIEAAWRKLKEKFPELSEQDKGPSMKQVESQYNNRRYRLLQAYKKNKERPPHVSPDDWRWLIRNLWTDPEFQKRSNQNSLNRGKQEMESKVGTKSIAQIAYELRDPETGAWPTAMQVWKATYQKADGTWSIPNGEETLAQLHEAAQTHQEQISSATFPMVEHFALVLGRKPNHSRVEFMRSTEWRKKGLDCVSKFRLQSSVQRLLKHVPRQLINVLRLLSNVHRLCNTK
ncbi:hypothetical protein ACP70R_031589 [Stipagrostis hirtigluma subsp. patula]